MVLDIIKEPSSNSKVEKYNNWKGKFTRKEQHQFEWAEERISKLEMKAAREKQFIT